MSHAWQTRFADRIASAPEAVRLIRPGLRLLIGSGAAEPADLVHALVSHGEHLADNEVVHLLTLGPAPYVQPGLEARFRHAAFFIGPNTRQAVQEGRADFIPVFLSELPQLIRSRRVRIDVALIQVSPPDRHGYVSLGVSVDIVRAAVESAALVIAEINPRMPRTLGDSMVQMNRFARVVPVDADLPELAPPPLDEVSLAIGRNVASLVPDGATLQTGIGRIPHAICRALKERHELGFHTEMLSDSVLELVECGAVTGSRKTLLPGRIVTSFVMGTRRLYDFVDNNPGVELRPSEFTNDPFVIAQHDDMISINSALAVDLTGQVAADTVGGRFFSGIGGQVDFIRGAARSRRGKPIIALPSTAKSGSISRIQATLEAGAGIVTSRGDVHYVVTEYGVADLWGKTVRQRALALIEIAHPDHRSELISQAKQRRYVFLDQPPPAAVYPSEQEELITLAGLRLAVRPLRMSDERALQEAFYSLSNESVRQRFLQYRRSHSREEMQKLVDVDYDASMALVVTKTDADNPEILGMARYDVDPATQFADIAFVVRDDWQRKGIGTHLMRRMAAIALDRGLRGFTADVLATNAGMLAIFQKSGLSVTSQLDAGVHHLTLSFPVATESAGPRPTDSVRPPPPESVRFKTTS